MHFTPTPMKLEEFLEHALNQGFTLRKRNGVIEALKDNRSVFIREQIYVDYDEFLSNFERSLPQDFNTGDPDLFPSTPGIKRGGGLMVSPDDPLFDERSVSDINNLIVAPPPLARYDDIMPDPSSNRKKNKKKRSGDPDPDDFRGPSGGDYFMD